MPIEVDIKRKFIVNNREYGSIDEVPEDIREAIQKTIGSGKNIEVTAKSSIVFNGKEYKDTGEMPSSDRRMYEHVMKAVASGNMDSKEIDALGRAMASAQTPAEPASSSTGPGISLSFSLNPLFAVLVTIIAALALYFFFL